MSSDNDLLRRFVEDNAEDAFASLVRNKIHLVYAAALRQVRGDAHLAQDVTQAVFVALACNAGRLQRHPMLTGWLFSTTRNVAAKVMRTQQRWKRRETEAIAMNMELRQDTVSWHELAGVLDEAMHELGEKERTILLLRFFDGKTHAEAGAAIGVAENAARMRIERALEKLRTRLAKRGITSTAAALSVALASQSAVALPVELTGTVTQAALAKAGLAAAGGASTASGFMIGTKLAVSTAVALSVFAAGALLGRQMVSRHPSPTSLGADRTAQDALTRLRAENQRLVAQITHAQAMQRLGAGKPSDVQGFAMGGATSGSSSSGFSGTIRPLSPEALKCVAGKWHILAELQKDRITQMRLPLVDAAGNLSDAAVSVFDLTPAEQEAIKEAINRAREQLEPLERENATVTRTAAGEYVISLNPFPKEGGLVYDELTNAIAKTLGPDRNAAFVVLAADLMDNAFAQFGATERTVTIAHDNRSNGGYYVQDVRITPRGRSRQSTDVRSHEDLLNRVGTVTKLLPPDF